MFGHRCVVVLDELFDDEELDPVDPDDSSAFVAFATATFGVFACAGAVAALAIAAPPNPSPNAPETTAAAMRGFFIRMLHLLLSAHIRGLDHGGLPRWPFDRTNLEQTCGRRVAHLRFDESVANGQVSDPATVDLLARRPRPPRYRARLRDAVLDRRGWPRTRKPLRRHRRRQRLHRRCE